MLPCTSLLLISLELKRLFRLKKTLSNTSVLPSPLFLGFWLLIAIQGLSPPSLALPLRRGWSCWEAAVGRRSR